MSNYKILVTGGGAINTTSTALTSEATLEAITIHVGVAAGAVENLVVTVDAIDGSAYDTVILTQAMAGVTDVALTDLGIPLYAGDALKVTWTNTDSRTIGVRLCLED
jgi:hypothetical protein